MNTMNVYVADIHPHHMPTRRVPREFNNNKEIKGVYMYITDTLTPLKTNWEDIAKRFCKEQLRVTLEGKGSTRAACRLIQDNWGAFVNWSKKQRA